MYGMLNFVLYVLCIIHLVPCDSICDKYQSFGSKKLFSTHPILNTQFKILDRPCYHLHCLCVSTIDNDINLHLHQYGKHNLHLVEAKYTQLHCHHEQCYMREPIDDTPSCVSPLVQRHRLI